MNWLTIWATFLMVVGIVMTGLGMGLVEPWLAFTGCLTLFCSVGVVEWDLRESMKVDP